MIKLPKKISMAGFDIAVVPEKMLNTEEQTIGKSLYLEEIIYMDTHECPEDTTKQALMHEMVHWILFIMGRYQLKDDEQFVDMFSHLLYQGMKDVIANEIENHESRKREQSKKK